MSSVQPLVITYSFTGTRDQATDQVDLTQLDAQFAVLAAKINEVIAAIDVTTRADNTLIDKSLDSRCLSDEALQTITAQVNAGVVANP